MEPPRLSECWEHYPRPVCLTGYLRLGAFAHYSNGSWRPQPAALEHRPRTLETVDSPGSVGRCDSEDKAEMTTSRTKVRFNTWATTTTIRMHLRNLATRHRGETAGSVAAQAADLRRESSLSRQRSQSGSKNEGTSSDDASRRQPRHERGSQAQVNKARSTHPRRSLGP